MSFPRWLGVSFAAAITAAFAACSGESGQTGAGPTTSRGGSGGSGGSGGDTSIITTTTPPVPEAGPIKCTGQSTNVPKGDCDALQQDCPPGQTCRPAVVDGGWRTQCGPADGLKTAGEPCGFDSECSDGLFCILDKCTPVCCRDKNEPCAGGICNVSSKYGSFTMFFCHYAPTCDLLTANACAPGLSCHIEDVTQGLATCGEPSGANAGDQQPCEFINDCGDMQQCHTVSNKSICRYYCWMDAPPGTKEGLGGCPSGQVCRNKIGTNSINYGVPGLGLCFATSTPPPDGGVDAGHDAGDAGDDDDAGDGGDAGTGGTGGTTSGSTSSSSSSSMSGSTSSTGGADAGSGGKDGGAPDGG